MEERINYSRSMKSTKKVTKLEKGIKHIYINKNQNEIWINESIKQTMMEAILLPSIFPQLFIASRCHNTFFLYGVILWF